jgi:hypothetical protein
MTAANDAPYVAESPERDPAPRFLLDAEAWITITCPACGDEVTIVDGLLFRAGATEGAALDHEPTMADLIDAANDHKCDAGHV